MIIGKTVLENKPIKIDLDRILDGRMLLQANSGGGKSYAVRKVCEVTHHKVQQIILDPEGELQSLREKFDYLLIGKDGDLPINLRATELLARKLLELGSSVIIDLYELKKHERIRFVKDFLDSMIDVPKNLWHPCIVIVDEAHIFAPESSHGQADSLGSIIDMATRGRKRGFALIVATQRLAKLSKDVVAELNTKLIGRTTLDIDMKRAGYELGFTDKKDIFSLRELQKGEFFAFGSALTSKVTKIKIGKCITTHPKAGKIYKKTRIATSSKIKKVLSKLADLPKEAESEIKTKEDMARKILELKKELSVEKRKLNTGFDKETKIKMDMKYRNMESNYKKELAGQRHEINTFKKIIEQIQNILPKPKQGSLLGLLSKNKIEKDLTKEIQFELDNNKSESINDPAKAFAASTATEITPEDLYERTQKIPSVTKLRVGAMKMLKVAAMFHPRHVTKQQIGTMAGFSIKGGTFNTYLSELKRAGWIEMSGDYILITESGLNNVGNVEPLPTDSAEILALWIGRFRVGAAKMLKVIASVYPNSISKERLGEETNFTIEGGTFNTYLSELKRNGLITISGESIKASKELFPLE